MNVNPIIGNSEPLSGPPLSLRVHIEYVADRKSGDNYVFVRLPESVNFRLTPSTTLGGCAVASFGLPPRTDPPGQWLTLLLKSRRDLSRLSAGQDAWLENVQQAA
jgi:hypothetical protein